MYWFGQQIQNSQEILNSELWKDMPQLKRDFARTSTNSIINLLHDFGLLWQEGSALQQAALPELIRQSGLSAEATLATLNLLPGLLNRHSLEQRLAAEFTGPAMLEGFVKTPHFQGRVKAIPRGLALHVTAGNVFLSSLDSLVMGLITKNLSIVKVSSQNTFFPEFFARKLQQFDKEKILADKFAILHWQGGDQVVESFLKNKVDTILAWGGAEMLKSYQLDLPHTTKLLDFGPKVSLQLMTLAGIAGKETQQVAQNIVADIIPWDQAACSSPQNLFIQQGIDPSSLLAAVELAFKAAPARGSVSADEATEILKEKYRGFYSALMEGGAILSGEDYLIHLEKNPQLRSSPLNRSLIVKTFTDAEDLARHLAPFGHYLQSCSYLLGDAEKEEYLSLLASCGIRRFAPLGTITQGMNGAPHDGRLVLRELVHLIGDEVRAQHYTAAQKALTTARDLKEFFDHSPHPPGYIFSSGGTTGEPKYVHFSYQEFDFVTDMLAENFLAQGLTAGMTVANLFVAGNLWSSFMAVEKALQKIGAIQLPIGGLCANENIIQYLQRFRPEVVVGIPSLLLNVANLCQEQKLKLKIDKVFYAGEAMSASGQQFLSHIWQTQQFGSAGYASVDAGVIGFQCSSCRPGEHHLFDQLVAMEIVEGEAVISSFYRSSMPVKNYRTGDRVEWIDACACGRPEPRFKLLGRMDETILIWSCRLALGDIEQALLSFDPEITTFQVKLTSRLEENFPQEQMQLIFESNLPHLDHELILRAIYHQARDIRDTLSLDFLRSRLTLTNGAESLFRNARTGKIPRIIDQRN